MKQLLLLNNYLHDVTAALVISVPVLFFLIRRKLSGSDAFREVFITVRKQFIIVFFAGLALNLASGALRAACYTSYEWKEWAGQGQVAALVLKHVLLFGVVAAGSIMVFRNKR